ncbi:MAG TPA: pirin family protein [Actinomycetota bacterium]|nr:pirin family protein [Actinomycetota bacterium]
MQRTSDAIVLTQADVKVLGEDDFGVPGLVAHEWLGPFVDLQAVGPLIMVHDGVFDPHKGITHHPHRFNERLFYILEGVVEHDDALNAIQGRMETGDLGRLTEGARGMYHKEWNVTDGRARAFILVYGCDPVPPRASFRVLRDSDAPRYHEAEGVRTKEMVGPKAEFPLHGDVRWFTDSWVDAGADVLLELGEGEGGLIFPVEGEVAVDGERLDPEAMAVFPPSLDPRSPRILSPEGARILRVVFGLGDGLFVRSG